MKNSDFVALDFETACHRRDSACAVALVRVEKDRVTKRIFHLIKPPQREFVFTHIHGISWKDVAREKTFAEIWPSLLPMFRGVEFIAAHNAPFDRSVMHACCEAYGLKPPDIPFVCTVRLAREKWGLNPTTLPDVCGHLRIELDHHNASSDAYACAQIVIASRRLARSGRP